MIKRKKGIIEISTMYNSTLNDKSLTLGITLIALIITIIVLLILAGVTIGMLTGDNSILKSAEIAKEKTRQDAITEARDIWFAEIKLAKHTGGRVKTLDEILLDLSKQGLLTESEVNTIKESENNEITIGSKAISFKTTEEPIANVVKVGDYVAYSPDKVTVTGDTQIIKDLKTYSGNTETEYNTEKQITQENLNWRVLDIVNGQVTLISDTPTTNRVYLYGANGYNNAVKLLDDLCKTLYSKTGVGEARNLKIEDIQDKMNITDYSTIDPEYGKTFTHTNRNYPNIFVNEDRQFGNGEIGKLSFSEQDRWYTGKSTTEALNTTYTCWEKSMVASNFKDYNPSTLESMYYKLFINNGSNYNTYWLSSRYVLASSSSYFCVRLIMGNGKMSGNYLYTSYDGTYGTLGLRVRPVVTLESNIQIDRTDTTKDGSTKELAWVLK